MKKIALLVAANLLAATSIFAQTTVKITLQTFATGLTKPVGIETAGDSRLFVIEQAGVVKIVDSTGAVLPTPFLDIKDIVLDDQNERGLLGLAFSPNFAQNGFFYVNYTENSHGDTQISRFSIDPTDPNKALAGSETKLLNIVQPYWNHDGGCMKFGPDGYLYIGMGDGGSGNDPGARAQNGQILLGKMLRIDVNTVPYSIPADNPFVNDSLVLDEIWTMGMRNPWRFSFDRSNGDLWIGDVGQNAHEEIDRIPAGQGGLNMGWRVREGFYATGLSGPNPLPTFTDPVFDWANPSIGCSAIGGFVYRGAAYPTWNGIYICADYCSGRFWTIEKDTAGVYKGTQIANLTDYETTSFGQDKLGRLYTTGHTSGKIYKICSTFTLAPTAQNVTCSGGSNGAISLTINDLQGSPSVIWSNGATTPNLSGLAAGSYTVTVSDANQCFQTKTVNITQPTAPTPQNFTISGATLTAPANFSAPFQWFLNGAPIAGANSNVFVASENGDYSVSGVDATSGCALTSTVLAVVVVATELPADVRFFKLSPNPFQKTTLLEMELGSRQAFSLKISDSTGRLILEKKMEADRFSKSLDLSREPAGTYFLTIELPTGTIARQLVKQ